MHHQEEGRNRIAPETSHPAALGPGHLGPGCSLPSLPSPGQGRGVEYLGLLMLVLFRERDTLRAHVAASRHPEGARRRPSKDQ